MPVRGGVVSNDGRDERCPWRSRAWGWRTPSSRWCVEQLRTGRLQRVLEPYAPTVPGFFLYFPSRAQRSAPLRLFVETAKEVLLRSGK